MIDLGKGAQRQVNDYMLSRYACYLVAEGLLKKDEDFPTTYEIQNPLDQHDARVEQGGHHGGYLTPLEALAK